MLLDEIIDTLTRQDSSLVDALLQTKVLLHQIGKKELADWVNHELDGYPNDAPLPSYRVLYTQVLANMSNVAWRISAHPIPLAHLRDDRRHSLEQTEMRQGLAVIEDLVSKGDGGSLHRSLPPELYASLGKGLSNGFKIERAWCEISRSDAKGILTQVRSRLLDFLLALHGSVGSGVTEANLKQRTDSVDMAGMLANAVFGPHATIILGSHNTQIVSNAGATGDIAALTTALKGIGIPEDEIEGLHRAIDADNRSGNAPGFEGETGAWYARLAGRAAKGAIGVSVDLASSVVAKILAAYLGMPQ